MAGPEQLTDAALEEIERRTRSGYPLSNGDKGTVLRLVAALRAERELLVRLSHAVGQYVECDERPRPTGLWTAMCEAQSDTATFLNTGALSGSVSPPTEQDAGA